MTIADRPMACHRHLTKSKFGFVKMFMAILDAQGLRAGFPGERELEQSSRNEDGREQVREEPDGQRRGKPANRSGAELEEEDRGNEQRDVRAEQREEDGTEG